MLNTNRKKTCFYFKFHLKILKVKFTTLADDLLLKHIFFSNTTNTNIYIYIYLYLLLLM